MEQIKDILTIRQFVSKHIFLTENAIRWMLYKDEPGLEDCLVRISRRIYIREGAFFDFINKKDKEAKKKKKLNKVPYDEKKMMYALQRRNKKLKDLKKALKFSALTDDVVGTN